LRCCAQGHHQRHLLRAPTAPLLRETITAMRHQRLKAHRQHDALKQRRVIDVCVAAEAINVGRRCSFRVRRKPNAMRDTTTNSANDHQRMLSWTNNLLHCMIRKSQGQWCSERCRCQDAVTVFLVEVKSWGDGNQGICSCKTGQSTALFPASKLLQTSQPIHCMARVVVSVIYTYICTYYVL
jgi:hypothetical protein